jgi:hypothetical protein
MKKSKRLFVLIGLLILGLAGWLVLLGIEHSYQEPPNYSVMEEGLYLGGYLEQPPPATRAVLNLCEVPDPYQCEHHTWEPIRDAAPAPDLDWLRRMVEMLDTHRKAGLVTFVHCRAGVSRSGMVVTAYLMARNRWTRDQALAFIRTKRPEVRPNPAFMDLLLEWEQELFRENPD